MQNNDCLGKLSMRTVNILPTRVLKRKSPARWQGLSVGAYFD